MTIKRKLKLSYLRAIFLVFLLFAGQGLLTAMGYPQSDFSSNNFFRLHPVTYLLMCFWFYNHLKYKQPILSSNKTVRGFLIIYLLTLFYSYSFGNSTANIYLVDTFLNSYFLISIFDNVSNKSKYKCLFVLRLLFILNCTIAIVERVLNVSFFPIIDGDILFSTFRSSSLLGHPLNNSLITCFLTLFFIIKSNSLYQKCFYALIGLVACFAFGGRTGLIGLGVGFFFISIYDIRNSSNRSFIFHLYSYATLFLLLVCTSGYLFFETQFGERFLIYSTFDDDSAAVRFDVLNMFSHLNYNDFIFGVSQKDIDNIMYLENLDALENFWVIWVFKYGFILTILLGYNLVKLLSYLFGGIGKVNSYILIITFLFVASGNNSLATSTMAINIITLSALSGFKIDENSDG